MNRHCGGINDAAFSIYAAQWPRYEEDHVEALETVRATLTEGKKAGAVDIFIGGDLNVESGWKMSTMIFTAGTVSTGDGCTALSVEGGYDRLREI